MSTSPSETRLSDLLIRWEEHRERGETPSVETLCADCPELAPELRRRIEALQAMDLRLATAASQADGAGHAHENGGPAAGPGRSAACAVEYADLRFHAAGGLGEVFLARGADLNREVALKFLKRRRAHDPDSRRRFLLEAEVTGRLEHPGIVPVYGLGTDSDGQPCYAMRFIRGQTLDQAIARYHEGAAAGEALEFHSLLRRFAAVCSTVAYAHSRGILHRDIKPRNIMLGPYDETLVVDWGLARPVGGTGPDHEVLTPSSGSSGSGPPTAGVIGTPGYMSPEQAEGRWDSVGPASDIYSLGATLYCVLTGRSPFQAESLGEVLDRVRRGDFPPPRAVRPSVPRALDAVCRKAMALRPEDRYASALDLAEDINRWLAGEPVSAWREPVWQRLLRWARRHKTLVAVAGAVLAAAVIALAIGAAAIAREQKKTAAERDRADANLKQARDAVDRYFVQISQNRLLNEPGLQPLRRELMQSAREYYEQIAAQQADDPTSLADLGMAYMRLAQITADIGSPAQALELNRKAREVLERLQREHPDEPRHRRLLASSAFHEGSFEQALGKSAEAAGSYEKARAAQAELAREFPTDTVLQGDLAATSSRLGTLDFAAGRMAQAGANFEASRKLFDELAKAHPSELRFRKGAASGRYQNALVLRETGKAREARAEFEAALALRETIVRDFPDDLDARRDLAFGRAELGLLLARDLRDPKAAEAAYQGGLETARKLAHDNPNVTAYQRDVAKILNNLGILYQQTNRLDQALTTHEEALAIRKALAGALPDVPEYRSDQAASLGNLGMVLRGLGQTDRAAEAERSAAAIFERLAHDYPEVMEHTLHVGTSYLTIGMAHSRDADWKDAVEAYNRALPAFDAALAREPKQPYARSMMAYCFWGRAEAQSRLGHHAEALADLEQATSFDSGTLREGLKFCRALVLARRGDADQAIAEAKAVDPRPLTEGGLLLPGAYQRDMAAIYALSARATAADPKRAGAHADQAMDILRAPETAKFFPDTQALNRFLKGDDDFSALRERDDFKALVSGLEHRKP